MLVASSPLMVLLLVGIWLRLWWYGKVIPLRSGPAIAMPAILMTRMTRLDWFD